MTKPESILTTPNIDYFFRTLINESPSFPLDILSWAKNLYIPSSISTSPGLLSFDSCRWQEEVLKSMGDNEVERVVLLKSSQVGGTFLSLITIFYFLICKHSNVTLVLPDIAFAREVFRTIIYPFALSESIAPYIKGTRAVSLNLNGSFLRLVGTKTKKQLNAYPANLVFIDEIDRCDASVGGAGDLVELAIKRGKTFSDFKLIICGTPLIKESSLVTREWNSSSQAEWMCPCPKCSFFQKISFRDSKSNRLFVYETKDGEYLKGSGRIRCQNIDCRHLINEEDRIEMINDPKSHWDHERKDKKEQGFLGYHIWSGISNFVSIEEICSEYHRIGSLPQGQERKNRVKAFLNETLGESFQIKGYQHPRQKNLEDKKIDYLGLHFPKEVFFLTCGVDVQGDRLIYHVLGWDKKKRIYSIDWGEINGFATEDSTYFKLNENLINPYVGLNEKGEKRNLRVHIVFIDSGHGMYTEKIYSICRRINLHNKNNNNSSVWYPIKGHGDLSFPPIPNNPRSHYLKILRDGNKPILIGVNKVKEIIYEYLFKDIHLSHQKEYENDSGFIFFPLHFPVSLYKELTSEDPKIDQLRDGNPCLRFTHRNNIANHTLDCWVYAFAAFEFFLKMRNN